MPTNRAIYNLTDLSIQLQNFEIFFHTLLPKTTSIQSKLTLTKQNHCCKLNRPSCTGAEDKMQMCTPADVYGQ